MQAFTCDGVRVGRPFSEREVALIVAPAYQHRQRLRNAFLPHARCNIADRQADAAFVGLIGVGAVHDPQMVQRHLARLQHKFDGAGLVDRHRVCLQIVILRARATTGQLSSATPLCTAHTSLCSAMVGQMWRGMP